MRILQYRLCLLILKLLQLTPKFIVRTGGEMTAISSRDQIVGSWTHLVGALTKDRELRLYVNGDLAAKGEAPSLITKNPQESLSIGADDGSTVGDYTGPGAFMGIIDEVKVRVPRWKKEHYTDGDSGWVKCEHCAGHAH